MKNSAASRRIALIVAQVVYQFSWSPSLYCANSNGFTRPINETDTLPLFGSEADIVQVLATDRCGAQINTSYVERDNLTSRHSNGRLVRKTLSHSKKKAYLQRHIDLEDAIYNFVRPHSALKLKLRQPAAHGRRWQQRTPAIAAGLTDHIWSLEELLSYCLPPPRG